MKKNVRIWTYRAAEDLKTGSKRADLTGKGQYKSHCRAGQFPPMTSEMEHDINTQKIAPGKYNVCEREAGKNSMDL